ncbi:MAG: vWA domain-containing protein [Planctomycetota bacterium]
MPHRIHIVSEPPSINRLLIGSDSARRCQRAGATLVLMLVLLPVVLMVASYAVNVVYLELMRTELQIATDVSTRAAGRALAVTGDPAEALATAKRLAGENNVAGQPMTIGDGDLQFGVSTRDDELSRYEFGPGERPNSVRVDSNAFRAYASTLPAFFPTLGVPLQMRPLKTAIGTQTELDIAIVMDRSYSMTRPATGPQTEVWSQGAPAPSNARWRDAEAAVQRLLVVLQDSLQTEQVSLSTFSATSQTEVKLTSQYADIADAMRAHSDAYYGLSTQIGLGILEGMGALSDDEVARPWASRVMIVMSDGLPDPGFDARQAARMAADQLITICTVSFSDEADQALMSDIAEIGAGIHLHADTPQQLATAFEAIIRQMPTLLTL